MSQAPNPFTQAASQGYGDYGATLDDDEEEQDDHHIAYAEEEQLEGPQSPEPEDNQVNELGFTQTQERSYPVGIESPDEDENEAEGQASDNDEQAEPSSPQADDSNEQQDNNDDDDDEDRDAYKKQSQSQTRRRVQIMNDSDNEDEAETKVTSAISKEKTNNFLKNFKMKTEDSHRKHKKRHSDEHHSRHEEKAKRFRKSSNEDDDNQEKQDDNRDTVEAPSDVEDVVDDIFGKETHENEDEVDDQEEAAAELADLDDNEVVQEGDEEDDAEQRETFDTGEDEDEGQSEHTLNLPKSKSVIDYDIDVYLERKAEQRRGRRGRGKDDGDSTDPHADQLVGKLINKMKIATEEDRIFNKSRQPATAKLLLLPIVEQHLCRADLTERFFEHGILGVFKDWLSPLPDKSLPNIKIRESIIKNLQQFGSINTDYLRSSGIGKALMFLYKHPRETKENKIKLIKIIHEWARPIFELKTDYKSLTRDAREKRDVDQAKYKRETSISGKTKSRNVDVDLPFASNKQQDDDELNDDDCPRARVPRPSNRDYVKRPVSAIEYSDKNTGDKKKTKTRFDEIKQQQQYRKRSTKPMSIVKLSIEGNKMHL